MDDEKKQFLDFYYSLSICGKGSLLEALFWEIDDGEKLLKAIERFKKEKGIVVPWQG